MYTQIIFPNAASSAEPWLSSLQKAMLDATPDCIKVVSVDGRLLMMNRAGCVALNVPQDSEFGMPWLPLLPEEVHQSGEEALRKAVKGQNARFHGKSISPDGTMYWDNLLTPVFDDAGEVVSILCVSRDVTEKALLEKRLEDAVGREKLLSREMEHRIKNLFSLVSGLIYFAEKEAGTTGRPETATRLLREKLNALARASDAAFGAPFSATGDRADWRPIDLETFILSVLRPYGDHCTIAGEKVALRRDYMATFALLLHELATNSMKYGALLAGDGNVSVRWQLRDDMLELTWIETGGPSVSAIPQLRGFGSEMVDRIVTSAGGTMDRKWQTNGLVATVRLPKAAYPQG